MDLYYAHDWSAWQDLVLLARTFKALVVDQGAYWQPLSATLGKVLKTEEYKRRCQTWLAPGKCWVGSRPFLHSTTSR
jgi:hypothetical protein